MVFCVAHNEFVELVRYCVLNMNVSLGLRYDNCSIITTTPIIIEQLAKLVDELRIDSASHAELRALVVCLFFFF